MKMLLYFMPSVERELGEIKTKIEFLTSQNKNIFIVIDELKENSVIYNEQIKSLLRGLANYKTIHKECDSRFNSIERGLSSKLIASFGAVVTSIFVLIYVVLG